MPIDLAPPPHRSLSELLPVNRSKVGLWSPNRLDDDHNPTLERFIRFGERGMTAARSSALDRTYPSTRLVAASLQSAWFRPAVGPGALAGGVVGSGVLVCGPGALAGGVVGAGVLAVALAAGLRPGGHLGRLRLLRPLGT